MNWFTGCIDDKRGRPITRWRIWGCFEKFEWFLFNKCRMRYREVRNFQEGIEFMSKTVKKAVYKYNTDLSDFQVESIVKFSVNTFIEQYMVSWYDCHPKKTIIMRSIKENEEWVKNKPLL